MATPEIIALLCAGSTRYHAVTGGGNGLLTKAEIAGLLSGLSAMAVNLALAKYACDLDAERALIAQVQVWAVGEALRGHWQIVRGRPTVVNMSALAVFEVVRPNRCPRCKGRGVDGLKVCRCCDGSGIKALSGRQVAEAIGVNESNYRRCWLDRYEQCIRYVQSIDGEVNRLVRLNDRVDDYAFA